MLGEHWSPSHNPTRKGTNKCDWVRVWVSDTRVRTQLADFSRVSFFAEAGAPCWKSLSQPCSQFLWDGQPKMAISRHFGLSHLKRTRLRMRLLFSPPRDTLTFPVISVFSAVDKTRNMQHFGTWNKQTNKQTKNKQNKLTKEVKARKWENLNNCHNLLTEPHSNQPRWTGHLCLNIV